MHEKVLFIQSPQMAFDDGFEWTYQNLELFFIGNAELHDLEPQHYLCHGYKQIGELDVFYESLHDFVSEMEDRVEYLKNNKKDITALMRIDKEMFDARILMQKVTLAQRACEIKEEIETKFKDSLGKTYETIVSENRERFEEIMNYLYRPKHQPGIEE